MNEEFLKEINEEDLNKTQTEIEALKNQKKELLNETINNNGSFGQNMSQSNENAKVRTLSNGHNIFPKDNIMGNNGFATKLLITLLAGFGLGAVATATYIFINLGKFTFTF